jgi:feruloyl esterase
VYEGPRNPITGAEIYPGLQRGTELGWGANTAGPSIFSTATQFFAFMVYNNPNWNYETFNFSSDVAFADKGFSFLIDAIDPDLSAFQRRGGKILQSHLWSSVVHPATRSIEYYDQVVGMMNNDYGNRPVLNANTFHETQDFYRLFMGPGGTGSKGPQNFDSMPYLEQWVEHGVPPSSILASHFTDGTVDRTSHYARIRPTRCTRVKAAPTWRPTSNAMSPRRCPITSCSMVRRWTTFGHPRIAEERTAADSHLERRASAADFRSPGT